MIWIFNLERASASVCDNYHDVFHFIHSLEQQEILPSNRTLSQKPNPDSKSHNFVSDAEIKQWCLDFCKKNKYDIIETPTNAVNTSHSTLSHSPGQLDERFKHAS
jgi:hypothetical protein